MLQVSAALPSSSWDLVVHSSTETKVVLAITLVFSVAAWFVIGLKWWQFHRVRRQANRFFGELERTTRLKDAYHAVMKLPPSPFVRLFREGFTFINELKQHVARPDGQTGTLSMTQLEAFKMVLGTEVSAERGVNGEKSASSIRPPSTAT